MFLNLLTVSLVILPPTQFMEARGTDRSILLNIILVMEQMLNSRKQASVPIPAPILSRVRELADMQGQFQPILSTGKSSGHISGRSVNEARSGYL